MPPRKTCGLAPIALAWFAVPALVTGQQPQFRAGAQAVYTEVIARDANGAFVSDLRRDEFRVLEDGVEQAITLFRTFIGGRELEAVAARPATRGGLVLPPARQAGSGRVFVVFIDDLHLQAADTPRTRRVLEQIRDELIHDGDLVGIVSTGYSSIEVDLSYDHGHARFTRAIGKVMGSAPDPREVIATPRSGDDLAALRHNVHVAFKTAYNMLEQAAQITGRRKTFIYVSSGYHLNPFVDARLAAHQDQYASAGDGGVFLNPFDQTGQFSEADLIGQIGELVRAARRANVAFYAFDPRGLIAGPPIHVNLSASDWANWVTTTTSTLQALSDETGGFCACHTNDFGPAIRRIDGETSDYYMLGYTSNNPDASRVRRTIRIHVTRPEVRTVLYKSEYTLRRPSRSPGVETR
jgi:VWFA-related protein